MILVNPDGTIEFVNERAETLLNIPEDITEGYPYMSSGVTTTGPDRGN